MCSELIAVYLRYPRKTSNICWHSLFNFSYFHLSHDVNSCFLYSGILSAFYNQLGFIKIFRISWDMWWFWKKVQFPTISGVGKSFFPHCTPVSPNDFWSPQWVYFHTIMERHGSTVGKRSSDTQARKQLWNAQGNLAFFSKIMENHWNW